MREKDNVALLNAIERRTIALKRFVSILVAAIIVLSGSAYAVIFDDVNESRWYNDEVTTAVDLNLIQGYPDGSFRPDSPISYAEFVTIVARSNSLAAFSPQAGHWASGTMSAALTAGWYDWDEIPP